MGVPKFYRWISERYPCLSQVIKEYQIPEFDNMYLDMNGIIHPCSHPNDEDAHFRITEKEIFQNIFNYIECIFRLIKPKKLFFMAVDGVAPRAKMNQQRARRFRSALDAEAQKQAAIAKGEILPEEEKFDSNCITPGTEFMCKLHEQLKYFVNKKMSSDPAWQKVKVILSGHNVPGEGEHKIMEYLRYAQQQPDYDPDTRHCLYGLDADLILLGLATHELHFSLLREEVKFGKTQKRISTAEEQCFHLLHLSLFREYIDKEFQCLKEALGEEYDLDRVIDDYILLSFLVGNDFIPHLPDFHIHAGSLPILWKTYKEVRPNLNGYLHENGNLNMKRFATYLEVLSRFDMERFEVQYEDLKWMAGKSEERRSKEDKQSEADRLKEKFGTMMLLDSEEEDDSEEEEGMIENEFKVHKKRYYMEKFKKSKSEVSAFILEIGYKYVEGLNWILLYYFQGVPSWSWFYPYHYAPYLSDLQEVAEMLINPQLSEPFSPFQQLMAVLPPGSNKLLPAVLQELYKDPSPIEDFYPPTFETDLNGKKQEWEAVVLIPFIDESRLISAMEDPISAMTDDEKARNSHGPCIIGGYDESVTDMYPSSLPTVFPDIQPSHTRIEMVDKHHFRVPGKDLVLKIPDKSTDPFRMGFPSARHLKHTAEFEAAGCKIFQFSSKDANCILSIDPQTDKPLEDYQTLIGETVYVEYPHLVEALVVGVHTEEYNYFLEDKSVVKRPAIQGKKDCFKHLKSRECISLKSRWGLEVGDVRVMCSVQKIRGKVPTFHGEGEVEIVKHWCEEKTYVPGQLVISGVEPPLPVQEKCENLTLDGVFPQDAKVFVVSNPGYGSMGIIQSVEGSRVKVQLTVDDEPMLEQLRTSLDEHDEEWYYPREMCAELGISPLLLSKITSAFKISMANKNGVGSSQMNIGLNIKYASKCLMAPEYSRKIDNGGWQYSESLFTILKEYVEKFPELFKELEDHLKKDNINASDIATKLGPEFNVRKYLEDIRAYLKKLPVHNAKLVGVGSEIIGSKHLKQMLKDIDEHKVTSAVHEMVVKVKPRVLFNPDFQNGVLPPDAKADFLLLDRVVNVCASHCVPFGYKGTIVGIKYDQERTADSTRYEVLFDKPFIGGLPLGDSCPSHLYTMLPFTLMNISYGTRLMHGKVEKPSKQKTQRHESNRPPTTRQQHSHRGGGDDPYTTSSRGSGAPPRGGAMRSDRKELLRRPESGGGEHHARKYVGESRRGGGTRGPAEYSPRKQEVRVPPGNKTGGPPPPPRRKQISAEDLSEDDHLNYRENKHSMRGRHTSFHSRPNIPPPISAAPYMSGPPFPPVSPNGAPYQPISPSYGGPVQIPPEYYGMPPNNFQSGYQQPYYNQGYTSSNQYIPPAQGYVPQQGYVAQQGYGPPVPPYNYMQPAFTTVPYGAPYIQNPAMYMNPMGYNASPSQSYPYIRNPYNGKDRSNSNKPRSKHERRQAEAEYEGEFYHADFYNQPVNPSPVPPQRSPVPPQRSPIPPQQSPVPPQHSPVPPQQSPVPQVMTGDPYIDQPGMKLDETQPAPNTATGEVNEQ